MAPRDPSRTMMAWTVVGNGKKQSFELSPFGTAMGNEAYRKPWYVELKEKEN